MRSSGACGSVLRRLAVVTLGALALLDAARAAQPLEWLALDALSEPVRRELAAARRLACGPLETASLPVGVPGAVRVVLISCHGGPYPCARRDGDDLAAAPDLSCPASPTSAQIATVAVVSTLPVERLRAHYLQALGEGFAALGDATAAEVAFVEKATRDARHPWSPKRLHLAVSPLRGALLASGYRSHVRMTLSLVPPSEPRPSLRCRRHDLLHRSDAERVQRFSALCY